MTINVSRKFSFVATAASAAMLLAACSAGSGPPSKARTTNGQHSARKPVVLTTFTVLADIAQNVAGDHLTVQSITKPGTEIHDYEPTPSDVKKAANADLVLDHGMGLETWFKKFISDAKTPHVVVSEGITPIPIENSKHANPHTWMSPQNVEKYTVNMADAFAKLDPANAADYRKNAQTYRQKLQSIQGEFRRRLDSVPQQSRVLTTCEGAFSYMAKDAGLSELYLWPVNSEEEMTAQQIAHVIDTVKQRRVPAVFCESTVNDRGMKQVASATGAKFGGVLYVDSLSDKSGPVPTYLDLIKYDAKTIADALTGK